MLDLDIQVKGSVAIANVIRPIFAPKISNFVL